MEASAQLEALLAREQALLANPDYVAGAAALAKDAGAILPPAQQAALDALLGTRNSIASTRAAVQQQEAATAAAAAVAVVTGKRKLAEACGFYEAARAGFKTDAGKPNVAIQAQAETYLAIHDKHEDTRLAVEQLKKDNPSVDTAKVDAALAAGEAQLEHMAEVLFIASRHGWEVANTLEGKGEPVLSDERAKRLKQAITAVKDSSKASQKGAGKGRQQGGRGGGAPHVAAYPVAHGAYAGPSAFAGPGPSFAGGRGGGRGAGPRQAGPGDQCFTCKQMGHFARDCPRRG